MPSKIRVLDEQTINKIAAGEVIENPASVVKELVENSLDAGADDICVEIKGGGRQLIRITDNGCGMNSDDALLCLERHATSKIRDVDDIHEIHTMGFRGEAIPSIASISKFTLMTCQKTDSENNNTNSTMGTMVIIEGGKIIQCCPVARSPGTTIEVKSLFFNVPVRRKFQKSPVYDANEILKMMSSLSLGYPHIKFQLINDQKIELSTHLPMGNTFHDKLGQRIKDILGPDFFESTCPVESTKEEYLIKGFIGLPAFTRHNRTGQYLFINQRAIFSPLVSFAVRDGFGTTLPSNRHPVYVLHLTIPGALVDVNVHPQKREVRLRQEMILKDIIREGISGALQSSNGSFFDTIPSMPTENENVAAIAPTPLHLQTSQSSHAPFPFTSNKNNTAFIDFPKEERPFSLPPLTKVSSISPIPPTPIEMPAKCQETLLPFTTPPQPKAVSPRVLATIKQYILLEPSTVSAEKRDHLCLVDQKAAHSRVIFERLQKQILGNAVNSAIQSLLIPYTFEVSPVEGSLLLEHLDTLNKMGVSIRQSGPQKFLVDGLPSYFGNTDLQSLISGLVHELRDYQSDSTTLHKENARKISLAASRASISHNARLSIMEAQSLIDQLMQCEHPYQCPLGKPTLISLTQDELDKKFLKG